MPDSPEDFPYQGSMFDTDDFYTYGTEPRETTYTGCGGEFCPGPKPDDSWTDEQWWDGQKPFLCAECQAGTVHTVTVNVPYDFYPR